MQVQSGVNTLSDIEVVLQDLVFNQVKDISDALVSGVNAVIIGFLLGSWVAVHGIKIMLGVGKMTGPHFIIFCLKTGGFYALAMNLDNIGWDFVNTVHLIPDHLINIVNSGSSERTYQGNMQFIDRMLATAYDASTILSQYAYAKSSFGFPNLLVSGFSFLVLGMGVLVAIVGAGVMFTAKFFLFALIGIGPLFVLFLLFKMTESLFISWMHYLLNAITMSVLCAICIRISYGMMVKMAETLPDQAMDGKAVISYLGLPVVFGLAFLFFRNVPHVSASLTGSRDLSFGNTAAGIYSTVRGGTMWGARTITSGARRYASKFQSRNEVTGA